MFCFVFVAQCIHSQEELQSKGIKCGGTHYQRAARLFSLKRVAPEEYPKGLLAKKAKT